MRRLIINADDFGLTPGINRGVARLFDSGALTSTTLMATGGATADSFENAVGVALERPGLGVGCHVVLVDGSPVSPADTIPSLLGRDGKIFRSSLIHFLRDLYSGRVNLAEVELEAAAQIVKLQRAGISVTHVDTHKHTHMFPRLATTLLNAAQRCGVAGIRNPFEQDWSRKLSDARWLRVFEVSLLHGLKDDFLNQKQIRDGSIRTTSGTIGIAVTGTLTAVALEKMFDAMPDGTWELVCHPGYNDADLDRVQTRLRGSRVVEMNALMEKIPEAFKNHSDIEFISYAEMIYDAQMGENKL